MMKVLLEALLNVVRIVVILGVNGVRPRSPAAAVDPTGTSVLRVRVVMPRVLVGGHFLIKRETLK